MPEVLPYSDSTDPELTIGLVSTYPPKLCGLATFANALKAALRDEGHRVLVVRVDDEPLPVPHATLDLHPVAARLVNGDATSIRAAAAVLSRCDVAIIQHEYGIFGGADGQEVIDLMRQVSTPTIVVLHTVPSRPSAHQHSLLVEIGQLADRLVVMSESARSRLLAMYPIDEEKVLTIPHGAVVAPLRTMAPGRSEPELLTWGLLGPGKGIEHTIEAIGLLRDDLRIRYTVAGVTHPKVLLRDGDRYRRSLIEAARLRGVADTVTFDDTYRDVPQLNRFVASASVVVLPYDSTDQVTSGVLVDAIAAGRPVIATAFPHAVELLATGAGIVVPHADTIALAAAIRRVLTEPGLRDSMAAEARRIAPSLSWATVGRAYAVVGHELRYAQEPIAI